MKEHNGSYPCPVPLIPGWMSGPELEWLYCRAKEHKVIVEVGSAYGRSTHALLTGNYQSFGPEGSVYCVDCWPAPVHGTEEFDHTRKALDRRRSFLHWCGEFPNLNIWEMPSVWAAGLVISQQTINPTMIFLDGGTANMAKDVALWSSCKRCTLLCGHDYDPDKYPQLARALEKQFGVRFVNGTSIWYVERERK